MLRDGDEQAQPGEQPEEDDAWTRPRGGRPTTLGQRLAAAVAEGTDTRAATGTEHTEWVERESFPGKVPLLASDKETAARVAKAHIDGPQEVSMWTDGSKLESGRTGSSVAWKQPQWRTRKFHLGTNKEVFDAELYAIPRRQISHGQRYTSGQTRRPR